MTYRPRDALGPPKTRLSGTQRHMLNKIGDTWVSIWDIGAAHATNMTLSNLERRGLVELRADPNEPRFLKWQARRVQQAAAEGKAP